MRRARARANKSLDRIDKQGLWIGDASPAAPCRRSRVRSRRAAREFHQRGGRARDDPGGGQLSDQAVGGAARRAAVPPRKAPRRADRCGPPRRAADHPRVRRDRLGVRRDPRGGRGRADRVDHEHLRQYVARVAARQLPDGASRNGGAPADQRRDRRFRGRRGRCRDPRGARRLGRTSPRRFLPIDFTPMCSPGFLGGTAR